MPDRQAMQYLEDDIVTSLVTRLGPTDILKDVVVTQLYPEYTFSQPFGVWTGQVPIYAVLSFYKQLIVHALAYFQWIAREVINRVAHH